MPVINTEFSVTISGVSGSTLLDYLENRFTYKSRAMWNNMLELNRIFLNGKVATNKSNIFESDELTFQVVDYHEPDVPTNYKILNETNELIFVHKPPGLPVHRTGRIFINTLVNLVRKNNGNNEINPLNRLDIETSGIVVFSKTPSALKKYSPQNKNVIWHKKYLAVCSNDIQIFPDIIDEPLATRKGSAIRCQMYVTQDGKKSLTRLKKIGIKNKRLILIASPKTGRKHQLRAHLLHIGTPILGDKIYTHHGEFYLKRLQKELTSDDYLKLGAPHHLLHCFYSALEKNGEELVEVKDLNLPKSFSLYDIRDQLTEHCNTGL